MISKIVHSLLGSKRGSTLVNRLQNSLAWNISATESRIADCISPERRVIKGPFDGINYGDLKASGSVLLPKLLGSYEEELHPYVERFLVNSYTFIVNIGCGEGYYAVGCARRQPSASVFVFDADPAALGRCRFLAAQHQLVDRFHFADIYTEFSKNSLPAIGPFLLIMDCEGAERELLQPRCLPSMDFDAIVELHEETDRERRAHNLGQRFRDTHEITIVLAAERNPDVHPELKGLRPGEQQRALDEFRPFPMRWLVLSRRP